MMAEDANPGIGEDEPASVGAVPWGTRTKAIAVDVLPSTAVLATAVLVALSVPKGGVWWWLCLATGAVAVLGTAFNGIALPAKGRQSLGRAGFGVAVVPGTGTESRALTVRRSNSTVRRTTGTVMVIAAALCAGNAAISYTVVRQRDHLVTQASEVVSAQGPRMVAQLLTYHPESIRADFDHALSLTTDRYREELLVAQQAAQKAEPVRNEYWVSSSSVIDATSDRVTMLLFLQGERGAAPNQRYSTVSVRATFVESNAAGWLVDDLAVVTDPRIVETDR